MVKEILFAVGGALTYVLINYIIFSQIEGADYFEVKGYINGLIRGAGSKEKAKELLDEWYNFWVNRKPFMKPVLDHFYNYGLKRIEALYR
ncbi:hypothetical protein DRN69_05445 [Candidatus Pacearchaeota archaeon]|nr:MAG: hypothetical protein DRN69_05445 [Candidatus Pacearchaeota archaeon]